MKHPTIWIVWFGSSIRVFYTAYHAIQFTDALSMNGTQWRMERRERAK